MEGFSGGSPRYPNTSYYQERKHMNPYPNDSKLVSKVDDFFSNFLLLSFIGAFVAAFAAPWIA